MARSSKAEALYREKGGDSPCRNCQHYSKRKCDVVDGAVSPDGTCRYHMDRANVRPPSEDE